MSILSKMGKLFELATSDAKSSDIEIDELIQYSKIDIPHEFLEIIEEKTELEILVNNKKYIRIWGGKWMYRNERCIPYPKVYTRFFSNWG